MNTWHMSCIKKKPQNFFFFFYEDAIWTIPQYEWQTQQVISKRFQANIWCLGCNLYLVMESLMFLAWQMNVVESEWLMYEKEATFISAFPSLIFAKKIIYISLKKLECVEYNSDPRISFLFKHFLDFQLFISPFVTLFPVLVYLLLPSSFTSFPPWIVFPFFSFYSPSSWIPVSLGWYLWAEIKF